MAKVLFINPIVRQEDNPKHVPYGIAMLASIIKKEGHKFQIFDANALRPSDSMLCEAIMADDWDVIAIGSITTAYGYIKKAVKYSKIVKPDATIILGGGVLTSMPIDVMNFLPEVDIGVVGEAYVTFPEILRMIDKGEKNWKDVMGIVWRDVNKKPRINQNRPLLQDIDSLPFPAWEYFPLDIYFKNSCILMSEEAMQAKRRLDINTSYGCSLICRFCFHLGLTGDIKMVNTKHGRDIAFTYDRELRWHSPRYIVNLVTYAKKKFGVDFIAFLDENLMTMNMSTGGKWLPDICELWIKEGLQPQCVADGKPHRPDDCEGVHWGGTSHATLVNPEVLRKMRNAGCTYLDYGLESFSDRILKNVGKGTTAVLNKRAIKITMEAGIRPIPNQIIGFPDEFFDSIRDDMKAWQEMGIIVYPFFATPYPGSEWYLRYKKKILEQYDGDLEAFLLDLGDATKITAVISENFNAVELLGIRELMVNFDYKRIDEQEKIWRAIHKDPKIPVFNKDDYYKIIEREGVTTKDAEMLKVPVTVK